MLHQPARAVPFELDRRAVRVYIAYLASYIGFAAVTFTSGDRRLFMFGPAVSTVLFACAVVSGLAVAIAPRRPFLWRAWAAFGTVASLGRCTTLVFLGSPDFTRRAAEWRGAAGWLAVWGAVCLTAGLSALVVTGANRQGR